MISTVFPPNKDIDENVYFLKKTLKPQLEYETKKK